jgi:DNA-directed RNA polymerase specialized sigma24 family protein
VVQRKKLKVAPKDSNDHSEGNHLSRLTNLVALLLVKGEEQAEKIRILASAGYTPSEISNLLGVTPNAVRVSLHRMRKLSK